MQGHIIGFCCFRYHKGTDFQANHNRVFDSIFNGAVVLDTTKVQIFKQITTVDVTQGMLLSCFRYHKGTDFQANHNIAELVQSSTAVVLDTTKVQIFKQITTIYLDFNSPFSLFQIPQRYRFSSKSQQNERKGLIEKGCFRYHKGTDFQANHNQKPR